MNRMLTTALVAGQMVFALSPAIAADRAAVEAALPKLTALAQKVIDDGRVPGLAIAIVHGDEVVYLEGFGVRAAGGAEAVGPDTVFPLASVSKPIAATVIAAMVGDGLVGWDTPIRALDPAFRFYDPYVAEAVTIRDLLSHRSGLSPNAGNDLELIGYGREDILDRLHLLPPGSGFRAGFAYSNYGVTIAAVTAAEAAGLSWEDAAEQHLYAPLGMTRTSSRFADFIAEPDRARAHTLIEGAWRAAPDHSGDAASPAGGVSSTARDLGAWLRLLLADGMFEGEQIIDAAALTATQTPVVSSGIGPATGQPSFYGLGWSIDTDMCGRHVNHNGVFTSGNRALVDLMPEEDIGIVVLANAYPSGVPEGLAAAFYELVFTGTSEGALIAQYDAMLTQGYAQFIGMLSGPLTTPPADPVAALPSATYVGTYANDYVGEVHVAESDEGLVLMTGPDGAATFPLRHYNRDVFYIAPAPDTPHLLLPVVFTLGPDGRATDMSIALIGGSSHDRLRRVSAPASAQ